MDKTKPIECGCGAEISKEQNKHNERRAKDTKTEKLNLCEDCWWEYAHHSMTGD